MTRPDRDYDDILSRVLHSTLDPIEPMGDGLAKIQRRIAEPWLKRQVSLLRTETSALGWLILVRCEPFLNWARSGLTAMAAASGRWLWPARSRAAAWTSSGSGRHGGARSRGRSADGPGWLGPTMGWLRPALAVAGAVAIVVAGVFAVQQAHVLFSPAGYFGNSGGSHGTGGNPAPQQKGSGSSLQTSGATGPGDHPTHRPTTKPAAKARHAAPSASCSSAPTSTTSPSPSPTTTSPTPTPTTTSPTPTPTSPSPTAPSGGPVGSSNGGETGSGNGGQTNAVAAVSFGAAKSLRGQVVRGSCSSPSSGSSGPTGSSSGSGFGSS